MTDTSDKVRAQLQNLAQKALEEPIMITQWAAVVAYTDGETEGVITVSPDQSRAISVGLLAVGARIAESMIVVGQSEFEGE